MSALTIDNNDQRQRWTVSIGFALILHGAIVAALIYGYERFGGRSTSSTVMIDLAPAGGEGDSPSVQAMPTLAGQIDNSGESKQGVVPGVPGPADAPGRLERSTPTEPRDGAAAVPGAAPEARGEETAPSASGGVVRPAIPAGPAAPRGSTAPVAPPAPSPFGPLDNSITVYTPYGWRPGKPGHAGGPGQPAAGHSGVGGIAAGRVGAGRSISLLRPSRSLAGRPSQQATQPALRRQQASPAGAVNSIGAHVEDRVRAAIARANATGEMLRNGIGGAAAIPGGGVARGAGATVVNAIGQVVPARRQAAAAHPVNAATSAAVAARIVAINGATFGRVGARPGAIGGPNRSAPGVIDGTTFRPRH
jgi:hypothetical protein